MHCHRCNEDDHDSCDGKANEQDYVNGEWVDKEVDCGCPCRHPLTRAEIYKFRKMLEVMS